ncbi:hypothetical protein GDO86_019488 [Hymenochirus boettgeri]|uniref:Uncharacterized protein n=1 Tax=Hymenochirus boettgeri TaxID=247094 RepID=A0A8T2IP45_9PIPI|nr:hypothetical protein GDO86_019488 [Hymenochirus boettgeri]
MSIIQGPPFTVRERINILQQGTAQYKFIQVALVSFSFHLSRDLLNLTNCTGKALFIKRFYIFLLFIFCPFVKIVFKKVLISKFR